MNKLTPTMLSLILLYGCMTLTNITNNWAYIDPMGGGIRLHINADSSFDYSMYYGLDFYHTNGNWKLRDDTLLLMNGRISTPPAIVHSYNILNKDSIQIEVQDTIGETIPFATVIAWQGSDTIINTETNVDGRLTLPYYEIDSFFISFPHFSPCLHKTMDITHNHYTFKLQDKLYKGSLYFDTLKYVKKRHHLQGERYRLEVMVSQQP